MLLVACIVACWPVWQWCAQRMHDKSDDPLGLLVLLVAVPVYAGSKAPMMMGARKSLLIAICLMAYAITPAWLPMLIRAGFAVTAIALLLSPRGINIALWGLLMLALPVVATMQFYLGYPMRLLVAHALYSITSIAGYLVQISGTDIIWNNNIIGIDPACSGVRMLWTAFFYLLCDGRSEQAQQQTNVTSKQRDSRRNASGQYLPRWHAIHAGSSENTFRLHRAGLAALRYRCPAVRIRRSDNRHIRKSLQIRCRRWDGF